ncbi:ZIP family metal transporter [Candidatus Peregrinibacteria bacterium]|nr:ZIP family metal transporter [Candidatus Peregrinibacteria bacterium]MBI3816716.1 ZIP family metal transporter [Candidatus Peregrinibacteria bacterium]
MTIVISSLLGVVAVSALSLLGIVVFLFDEPLVKRLLLPLVSFSTGGLLGDVFIHIIPDMAADRAFFARGLGVVLIGILFSFVVEKIIHWRHCHLLPAEEEHHHPVGIMSVMGESVHNVIDGVVIAASFLTSIPIGISTTLAVMFHEIPHEIGNVAVLLHSGYSRKKAVFLNLLSASAAILGTIAVLIMSNAVTSIAASLLPFAAGNLLYIAGADLIPELHRETRLMHGVLQLIAMIAGMSVMYGLLLLE